MNLSFKIAKAVAVPVLLLSLVMPTTTFAQMTKTPKLADDAQYVITDPYVLPDDYPQDILDYFEAQTDARSYIVVDGETNRVLAEKNANTRYPIASMSKVIAMYLVYQALNDGRLSLEEKVKIPQEIEDNFSFNPDMSTMGLYAEVEYTVDELIHGVMLLSGNDATSALMWHLFGSEQDGVRAMRELLASWGMSNFEIYTVSGIPNQYIPEKYWIEGSDLSDENAMTASDIAWLAQKFITDYPAILDVTSTYNYVAQEGTEYEVYMTNTNLLLPEASSEYSRQGVTGLKSGMTDAAGKNFVTTLTENGRQEFVVVMGLFDRPDMVLNTYWETEILLDKLAEYPDLYLNEALPTNAIVAPVAEEVTTAPEQTVDMEAFIKEHGIPNENRRDNPITNFMKSIFDIFK